MYLLYIKFTNLFLFHFQTIDSNAYACSHLRYQTMVVEQEVYKSWTQMYKLRN